MSDNAQSEESLIARTTPYYKKRYFFFTIASLVSLVLPFITINGNHMFLLSFDKKELHLAGIAFTVQQFYLMPFLLIFLFMFIFFLTSLGGRVWCGWACPQTIFRVIYRDVIEGSLLGMHKRTNKQKSNSTVLKKTVAVILWSALSLVAASNFVWYFVPPEDFFRYLADWQNHLVLVGMVGIIAGFLIYDVIILAEKFCVYVCPYVRIQSALIDNNTVLEIYDEKRGGVIYDHSSDKVTKIADKPSEGDCIGCMACVRVCPTHIDIRKGPGQLECINCLECSDACEPIMAKLGKPNLINWTSPNAMNGNKPSIFRFKTLAYMIVMGLCIVAVLIIGSKKESMLLNINRTSQLYMVKDEGKTIENAYEFLFENTQDAKHDFYFEVMDNPDIKIVKPSEPFDLGADKMVKKVVVLSSTNTENVKAHEDTITKIKIRAYAVDSNETVFVLRDTVFIYPGKDTIEKSLK